VAPPRVLVASFPHNPTTMCVDLEFMAQLVEFVRERDMLVVHDFAYADLGSTGTSRRRSCKCRGRRTSRFELYTLTKSFSMAGWRMASSSATPKSSPRSRG